MPTTTQTGGLSSQILEGADGANNTDIIYGDANKLKGTTVGGADTIIGGDDGAINYLYGDAYSMEGKSKGGADKITGGANGSTNYIYGDAYSMEGKVKGGNDILLGGVDSKNIIYGDAYSMRDGARGGDDQISANKNSLLVLNYNLVTNNGFPKIINNEHFNSSISDNFLVGDANQINDGVCGNDVINVADHANIKQTDFLSRSTNSRIEFSLYIDLDTKNIKLIGDAEYMRNSIGGSDIVSILDNLKNITTLLNNSSERNSTTDNFISNNFSILNNELFGDASIVRNSKSGDDNLNIGNNFLSSVDGIFLRSLTDSQLNLTSAVKFYISDNNLYGDSKNMEYSESVDDVINLGNYVSNTTNFIDSLSLSSSFSNLIKIFNLSIEKNNLFGDAKIITNSNSGDDIVNVANNFISDINSETIGASFRSGNNSSNEVIFNATSNKIYGDAEDMIYSRGGNDEIKLGNNYVNNIDNIIAFSSSGSNSGLTQLIKFFVSDNSLVGDAKNMNHSIGGNDNISFAVDFLIDIEDLNLESTTNSTASISIATNFSVSNNELYGDTESMFHSKGGDDSIALGNNATYKVGPITINSSLFSASSLDQVAEFYLKNNVLIGDAKNMDHSVGGDDTIIVGNNVVLSCGSVEINLDEVSSVTSSTSIFYSLKNNVLIGDAESMNYSKGGDDTLSIGVGIVDDLNVALDINDNSLYGDAKTMTHSQGGNDKLTGADGMGSVTYLYGDAQFTDGHSKAGDDVLTSGHGNDQMWGDFASVLNPVASSNDHDHEDDDEGDDEWDEHESDHDDDHHAPNPYKYAGKDTFVFKENNGNDTIFDFQHGFDKIDLSAVNIFSVEGLHIEQSAAHPSDTVIDLGGGNSITLVGVSNVVDTDFVFAGISI